MQNQILDGHRRSFFKWLIWKKTWISSLIFSGTAAGCPPKNEIIALWSATNRCCVVKCVSQKKNWSNNNIQWYNILVTLIFKFKAVYIRLKYVYSVISVIDKRLHGNTKKWTLVRLWPSGISPVLGGLLTTLILIRIYQNALRVDLNPLKKKATSS